MDKIQDVVPSNLAWERINDEIEQKGYRGETSKARQRRLKEGWFSKFAPEDLIGIDIGCQEDALNHTFRRFDWVYGDGDATDMIGVPNDTFWTVYASHVLEHLSFPQKAIRRWYEITKPGGHLIIIVPHRDLYERKRFPPSNWNPEHTYFWLPEDEDPPMTKSLKKEVLTVIPNANIVQFRVLDDGYDYSIPVDCHAVGEFSIECIIKK
jgi:SAM-dependent methyltransferase